VPDRCNGSATCGGFGGGCDTSAPYENRYCDAGFHQCSCTASSCATQFPTYDCGSVSDKCGSTSSCGAFAGSCDTSGGWDNRFCDAGFHQCSCTASSCSSQYPSRTCGSVSDKCGGSSSCGTCTDYPGYSFCDAGAYTCDCTDSYPDYRYCGDHGYDCGALNITDNCGVNRDIDCTAAVGACASGDYCISNHTCCTPAAPADFCSANSCSDVSKCGGGNCGSYNCAHVTATECAKSRTEDCHTYPVCGC